MRNDIDIEYFKTKLEEELILVENELNSIGRKNPSNKKDWEAEPSDMNVDSADSNEVADNIEELEIRYNDVKDALTKIEKNEYGMCEVSGEEIEEERLIANPAARTCKAHMES